MINFILTLFIIFSGELVFADFVITMGGDISLAKNGKIPDSPIYNYSGELAPASQQPKIVRLALESKNLFERILDGDLNFANLETVVSSNPNLRAYPKTYNFMTHPDVVRILNQIGFNLFSTANNHVFDYDEQGAEETLTNLSDLNIKHAGLAASVADAIRPLIFEINGIKVAFAAIGFGGVSTGSNEGSILKNSPGIIALHNKELVEQLLLNLAGSDANLKILSVHKGTEGVFSLDKGQQKLYHDYLAKGDIDLIIGHHPHVVRPIENKNGRLIFYSLGNYFMTGAANRDLMGARGNYGLFARVYFDNRSDSKRANGFRLVAEAAELIPLTHMHAHINTKTNPAGRDNLIDLQNLGTEVLGDTALNFRINLQNIGVFCNSEVTGFRARQACKTDIDLN